MFLNGNIYFCFVFIIILGLNSNYFNTQTGKRNTEEKMLPIMKGYVFHEKLFKANRK